MDRCDADRREVLLVIRRAHVLAQRSVANRGTFALVIFAARKSEPPSAEDGFRVSSRRVRVLWVLVPRLCRLPQLDPIAFGVSHPRESPDPFHVLRLFSHVRALQAQLREHRVHIPDSEVDHGLLGSGPEVVGLGLERRKHGQSNHLTPQTDLIRV